MDSRNEIVLKVLQEIALKIKISNDSFNAEDVSSALYGLRNMKTYKKEVRILLQALAPRIRECHQRFSKISVSPYMAYGKWLRM